jgi:hypothetical protein
MHRLKITDGWWKLLWTGDKTCEIRRNDRDFHEGDLIQFTDLRGKDRLPCWVITHVASDIDGIEPGFAVLSVRRFHS